MRPALAVVVAYLIGALPIGYLVARAFGMGDIRRHGSGNIGATNVLRTLGRLPAAVTLVGDVAKGLLAVAAAGWIAAGDAPLTAVGALVAVTGNCWSVFLGFRGGKGVATGFGALLGLVPLAALPGGLVWLAVTATFRYVSLASVTAVLCVPLGALLLQRYPGGSIVAAFGIALIVIVRHRDNITRLLAGTERRLGARGSAS